MKRCFIFKDGSSQKFWNIEVEGTGFTVTYGKLGTAGQTSAKSFADGDACQKAADKLIAEKTKKGYTEADEETVKNEKNEAKRYEVTYDMFEDKGYDLEWMCDKILNDKRRPEIKYITIGEWPEAFDCDCQDVIDMFVNNADKFAHLESLFIGDMDYEQCEASWIQQGNYSKLWAALPNLKTLKIKGSTELVLGKAEHENLREIEIICGGLGTDAIESIAGGHLPNLESLVLWLGVDNYGWDGSIEDLKPLVNKAKFPKLKTLGLVNSEIQDEIVELVLGSDILPQLEVLRLCYGNLTDKGGQLLLDAADKLAHLKKLDMEYHYLSEDMVKKLKKLPCPVGLGDPQDPDDDYMSPMLTE